MEKQGLNDLPYGSYDMGSLQPGQGSLIDHIIDGSWRGMEQNRGTMGSTSQVTPDPAVKPEGSLSPTIKNISPLVWFIGALAIAYYFLKGK